MISLAAAACFFVGGHLLVAGTRLRRHAVDALGEGPYRGLFSLLALAGFAWLCLAYGRAHYVPLWGQLPALKPAVLVVNLLAFALAVAGLTTPNPTAVGAERRLEDPDAAVGILRVTRHPFLWGVALWASMHLVVNGDLASLVLFGSFVLLPLAGSRSIDAKRAAAHGERWRAFAARTSSLPFAAVLSGRTRLEATGLGWRLALAVGLYALALAFHARVFGVSPFPT